MFPGLTDLLEGFSELEEGEEREQRREELEIHVSDLMIVTKRAADFLKETWRIV